jgi:hypothetical protein
LLNLAMDDVKRESSGGKRQNAGFFYQGKSGVNFADARSQQVLVRATPEQVETVLKEIDRVARRDDQLQIQAGPLQALTYCNALPRRSRRKPNKAPPLAPARLRRRRRTWRWLPQMTKQRTSYASCSKPRESTPQAWRSAAAPGGVMWAVIDSRRSLRRGILAGANRPGRLALFQILNAQPLARLRGPTAEKPRDCSPSSWKSQASLPPRYPRTVSAARRLRQTTQAATPALV